MKRDRLLLLALLAILPSVHAQAIPRAFERAGTFIFNFFQNDYIVFIFTFVFFFALLYAVLKAGIARIPHIGGEGGHGNKIAIALALLSTFGIFIPLMRRGVRATLEAILTPIGTFGGIALALMVFGFYWYTMRDGEGNRNWSMAFIAAGLALIFWGQMTNNPDAFAWGWVLLIIGLIGLAINTFSGHGEDRHGGGGDHDRGGGNRDGGGEDGHGEGEGAGRGTGVLHGHVTDAVTGNPIAGARIHFSGRIAGMRVPVIWRLGMPFSSVVTDREGRYRRVLRSGYTTVRVERQNYETEVSYIDVLQNQEIEHNIAMNPSREMREDGQPNIIRVNPPDGEMEGEIRAGAP